MPVTVLNTCLRCGKVFEANYKKDFCSSTCRWAHTDKPRARTREIEAEKKRIEEIQGKFRVISFFEDVFL